MLLKKLGWLCKCMPKIRIWPEMRSQNSLEIKMYITLLQMTPGGKLWREPTMDLSKTSPSLIKTFFRQLRTTSEWSRTTDTESVILPTRTMWYVIYFICLNFFLNCYRLVVAQHFLNVIFFLEVPPMLDILICILSIVFEMSFKEHVE